MQLSEIVQPLLEWYGTHARVLPWRAAPGSCVNMEPYRVWLSEIMLQQTRVEAAKAYYERFLTELPDIPSLAAASEEQLMRLWQGLGYYNRVRTMQRAARIVMEQYDGQLPGSYEELRSLPGFGEYTAGAVGSIAYGLSVPAVDGNVLRVVSRVLASFADISRPGVRGEITALLAEAEPAAQADGPNLPGDFNQALMELGAMVCLPNGAPKCEACPLQSLCRGYAQGVAAELPKKPGKPERKIEERTVFLLMARDPQGIPVVGLRKRAETGLLAGLWEFPSLPGRLDGTRARQALLSMGLPLGSLVPLKSARHIFSHVEWHMDGWIAELEEQVEIAGLVWAAKAELKERYALPSAFRAYYGECLRRM